MKAYVLTDNGPKITEVPQPQASGEQVLVRVRAACLNRADLGMAKGRAHGSRGGAGTTLGGEGAGEVVAVGPQAKGVKVGDRVMGSINGAFAEFGLMDRGPRVPDPGQQHELRAGGHPPRRAQHHAQRRRHRGRA